MRLLLLTLLAAISYAQTVQKSKKQNVGVDLSMLMPCEGRLESACNGHSPDGFCSMNYNKVPPRCEDGDLFDREDICASLREADCKSKQGCCWGMRDNFIMGKCVPFEMDVEDCPSMVLPRIFPAMGGGATDSTGGDVVTDVTGGDVVTDVTVDTVTGDANNGDVVTEDTVTVDVVTGDAGDQTPSTDATADQTPATNTVSYPFITPNPPIAERTLATFGCETQGMSGPDACNNLKTFTAVCGWNVKEGGCEEIELGKGNLCKTVADQATCNSQGDCCWDTKGYCGEYDFGDCLRPLPGTMIMPQMPEMPTVNIGGISFTPGMEDHMEMQSEAAEAKAEMIGDQHEAMMEGPTGELEFDEMLPVSSCDNLQFCHGRVGMTGVCVPDINGKCTMMNMPAIHLPSLRKAHQSHSSTSAPFNFGHLAMVLGGGLIVGLAAGMCFQNLRSKSSIAPVLLEDNYRNI